MLTVALLYILGGLEQRELLTGLILGQQIGRRDRQQPHGLVHRPVVEQQPHGQVDELAGGAGGPLERHLPRTVVKLWVADAELHGLAHHAALSQTSADIVAQRGQTHAALVRTEQIVRERHAVADRLDLALGVKRAHRLVILAAGVAQQHIAALAENAVQERRVARRQLTDGTHAQPVQAVAGAFADIEQRVRGHGPHALPEVLAGEHGRAIRFLVVAAELGERAVKRHTDRDRQPDLLTHSAAQLVRDVLAGTEQVHRAGDIEERLVNAERIDKIGVLQVKLVAFA